MDELEPKISKVLTKVIEFKNKTMDGMKSKFDRNKFQVSSSRFAMQHTRDQTDGL